MEIRTEGLYSCGDPSLGGVG
uniref:ORF I n=1 Tax=Cucumber mosaic virus satellite RNA TaxID=12436 RepID=Q83272_9VIRU|nr:ORF I [Cucumber mosaic virus satellite RNA]